MGNYSLTDYFRELFLDGGGNPVIFSTVDFWILLILIIAGLSVVNRNDRARIIYILSFSLFFYYKANGLLIFMMLAQAFTDWNLSRFMVSVKSPVHKKAIFSLSLVMNIGLLVYFKYSDFLLLSANEIFGTDFPSSDVLLPVGISFYTFQTVAYMTDVYKGRTAPASSLINYIFFLTFFPILLAGPIMRAPKFLPQIETRPAVTSSMVWGGFWLLLIGIIKKAMIADYIMQFNSWVFDSPSDYTGLETFLAVIGYSAQIYCDFSGYSDMAIGVGAIMGYDLGINFDRPFRSVNITEFWRRWHISLSAWLRDYIYIPLGGNRKGRFRMYANLFVTMTIAGIWHGASWLFVIWGAMHGIGLIIHKMCRRYTGMLGDRFAVRLMSGVFTFMFVSMLWPFFTCSDMSSVVSVYHNILTSFDISYLIPFVKARPLWTFLVVLVFVSQMIPDSFVNLLKSWFVSAPLIFKFIIFVVSVQLVIQVSAGNVAPFIYLQF